MSLQLLRRHACITLFSASAGCASLPTPGRTLEYGVAAHALRYDNGLQLLVSPDDGTRLASIDLRIWAGARDESPDKAGLAHLVEHVALELAPGGAQISRSLRDFGLEYNASTTADETHFHVLSLADGVAPTLQLYGDLLRGECDSLSPEIFERERAVVQNELRFRSDAYRQDAGAALLAAIYPAKHPYGRGVGGTASSVGGLTRDDVCGFMAAHYDPSRAAVIISGAVDLDEVRMWADALELVPARSLAPRAAVAPLTGAARRAAVLPQKQHGLALAFPAPPRFSADDIGVQMLARLGGAQVVGGRDAPAIVFVAQYGKPDERARTEAALWEGLAALAELVHARKWEEQERQRYRFDLVRALEPVSARSSVLADYLTAPPGYGTYQGDIGRLDALDGAALAGLAQRIFRRDRAVTIDITPGPAALVADAAANVRLPVDVGGGGGEQLDLDEFFGPRGPASEIEEHVLTNGLRVILSPSAAMPVLEARLIVHAGHADAPADAPLTAFLVAHLTAPQRVLGDQHSVRRIASLAGAATDISVGPRATVFSSRGLSIYVDHILDGLAASVREAEYDPAMVRVFRKAYREVLAELTTIDAAKRRLVKLAGSLGCDDLDAADTDYSARGLRQFRSDLYRADNATLVLTGKFDPKLALARIEGAFGTGGDRRWSRASKAKGRAGGRAPAAISDGPHVFVEAQAGSQQVYVLLGFPMSQRLADDPAAALVVRELVAAEVGLVRERFGASYTHAVEVSQGCGSDILWVSLDLEAARAGEATQALSRALAALRARSDASASLVGARRAVVGRLLADTSDSRAVADRLQSSAIRGAPGEPLEVLARRAAAVSPAQIQPTLAEALDPAHTLAVCLGPQKAAEVACAPLRQTARGGSAPAGERR